MINIRPGSFSFVTTSKNGTVNVVMFDVHDMENFLCKLHKCTLDRLDHLWKTKMNAGIYNSMKLELSRYGDKNLGKFAAKVILPNNMDHHHHMCSVIDKMIIEGKFDNCATITKAYSYDNVNKSRVNFSSDNPGRIVIPSELLKDRGKDVQKKYSAKLDHIFSNKHDAIVSCKSTGDIVIRISDIMCELRLERSIVDCIDLEKVESVISVLPQEMLAVNKSSIFKYLQTSSEYPHKLSDKTVFNANKVISRYTVLGRKPPVFDSEYTSMTLIPSSCRSLDDMTKILYNYTKEVEGSLEGFLGGADE